MSLLEQIARGGRYSGLDIAKAGTQGGMDALRMQGGQQEMQMAAMKMQAFAESSEIKRKSRKVMQSADLSNIEGTRETAQKLFEAGDVETGLALDADADKQEYQAERLALDKRRLKMLEDSWKIKKDIAAMKSTQNAKFKRATTAQMKSTGSMLINDETFNGLEKDHKKDYAAHMTQAVSDYMVAAKAAGAPVTGTEAFDAVSRFAQTYVAREGGLPFGMKNPFDDDKFDAETFRTDFMEMLPTMVGFGANVIATEVGIQAQKDSDKDEVGSYIDSVMGKP